MTILVFDVRLPALPADASAAALVTALADLAPTIGSYILSFLILGIYWVGHHSQFQHIQRADQPLIWVNIAFLMAVSLVPFSARLLNQYRSAQIAAIIYGLNLIAASLAHFAVWRYATHKRRLVDAQLDAAIISLGARLSLLPPVVYAVAIAVSFVNPALSVLLYAAVLVPYIFGVFYRQYRAERL
jgi:uncharacterized membrane protein